MPRKQDGGRKFLKLYRRSKYFWRTLYVHEGSSLTHLLLFLWYIFAECSRQGWHLVVFRLALRSRFVSLLFILFLLLCKISVVQTDEDKLGDAFALDI